MPTNDFYNYIVGRLFCANKFVEFISLNRKLQKEVKKWTTKGQKSCDYIFLTIPRVVQYIFMQMQLAYCIANKQKI